MKRRNALLGIGAVLGSTALASLALTKRDEDIRLLDNNEALIACLADTIIPTTDTPGAKDVQAEETIILLLKDCTNRQTVNNFISGLVKIEPFSEEYFGKSFLDCTLDERVALLNFLEKRDKPIHPILGKIQKKLLGNTFLQTLKEYTVKAYCTSQKGAMQGLSYIHIPAKRESCINLEANQKNWATQ